MPRLLEGVNFAKIVTVLAITFGVGFGLCGLNFVAISSAGTGLDGAPKVLLDTGYLELLVMFVSGVGLVLTLATWGLVGMINSIHDPQRLFDRDDETDDRPPALKK